MGLVDEPTKKRLDSWKGIAAYLNREVRTVQRWEKDQGLPVHRRAHNDGRPFVFAYESELDAWLTEQDINNGPEEDGRHHQLASLWQDKKTLGVIGLGAGLLLLTGALGWILPDLFSTDRSAAPLVTKFSISVPATQPLVRSSSINLAISPDGRRIVYVGHNGSTTQLYLRPLDEAEANPIPGTEGAGAFPFFSPDGQSLGFFADGKLKRVSLHGGPQMTLCEAGFRWSGGSWNSQDEIVFSAGPPRPSAASLYRVSALGGEPEMVATPDAEKSEIYYTCPKFLPGGKALFFDSNLGGPRQIRVLSLQTGEQKVVVEEGINAYYAPTGHLVYQRRGALLAAPFDLARLEVTGNVAPVMEDIRGVDYAIAADGTLVYLPSTGPPASSLVWVDREGTEKLVTEDRQYYVSPRISPDGTRIAIVIAERHQVRHVWIYDVEDDSFRQLTYEGFNQSPVWTPDGQWITFSSIRDGQSNNLYRKRADGRSGAERLTTSQSGKFPSSWSPDGNVLAFTDGGPGRSDIWILAMGAAPKSQPFISSSQRESFLQFSPDGQWVAYTSAELSPGERPHFGVYVCRYSEPDMKWLISDSEGGGLPVWSPDGSELFYASGDFKSADFKMMVVSIQTRPTFQADSPRVLFDKRSYIGGFDISADGQRFLMIKPPKGEAGQINVVLNWFEELKRLVPVTTG